MAADDDFGDWDPSSASLDEQAYFDTAMYYQSRPWCLFNVLMIESVGGFEQRLAAGRIHAGAFMYENPVEKGSVVKLRYERQVR